MGETDADRHTLDNRVAREVAAGAGALMAIPPLLRLTDAPDAVPVLIAFLLAAGLGALVLWRWRVPLPTRSPWYRTLVVTLALLLISGFGWNAGAGGTGAVEVTALGLPLRGLLAAMVVPAALGYELFLRGAVYSLVERRWGAAAAVLAAATPEAIAVLPTDGSRVTGVFIVSLLLGVGRATTGSVIPAVASQAVMALAAALFLLIGP